MEQKYNKKSNKKIKKDKYGNTLNINGSLRKQCKAYSSTIEKLNLLTQIDENKIPFPQEELIKFQNKLKKTNYKDYNEKFIRKVPLKLHISYKQNVLKYGTEMAVLLAIFNTSIYNKRKTCRSFFTKHNHPSFLYNINPYYFCFSKSYIINMYGIRFSNIEQVIKKYFKYTIKAKYNPKREFNVLNITEEGLKKIISIEGSLNYNDNLTELVKNLKKEHRKYNKEVKNKITIDPITEIIIGKIEPKIETNSYYYGLSGVKKNIKELINIKNNKIVVLNNNQGKSRIATNFTQLPNYYNHYIVKELNLKKEDISKCGTVIRAIKCYQAGLKKEAVKLAYNNDYHKNKLKINKNWHYFNNKTLKSNYLFNNHKECYLYINKQYNINKSAKMFFEIEKNIMESFRNKLSNYCKYALVKNDSIYYSNTIDYHLVDELFENSCIENNIITDEIKLKLHNCKVV